MTLTQILLLVYTLFGGWIGTILLVLIAAILVPFDKLIDSESVTIILGVLIAVLTPALRIVAFSVLLCSYFGVL